MLNKFIIQVHDRSFEKSVYHATYAQVMPCGTYLFVGICWNSLKQIFGSVFVFNDSLVVNLLRENISPCPSDRWVLHVFQKIHGHKVIVTLFENKNNSKLLRPF